MADHDQHERCAQEEVQALAERIVLCHVEDEGLSLEEAVEVAAGYLVEMEEALDLGHARHLLACIDFKALLGLPPSTGPLAMSDPIIQAAFGWTFAEMRSWEQFEREKRGRAGKAHA